MIQKMGVNLGVRSAAKAPQPQAAPQPAVKTVMSEKAKAALEVFASRQAGGPRERS
jgi:hypothetical protein